MVISQCDTVYIKVNVMKVPMLASLTKLVYRRIWHTVINAGNGSIESFE